MTDDERNHDHFEDDGPTIEDAEATAVAFAPVEGSEDLPTDVKDDQSDEEE